MGESNVNYTYLGSRGVDFVLESQKDMSNVSGKGSLHGMMGMEGSGQL